MACWDEASACWPTARCADMLGKTAQYALLLALIFIANFALPRLMPGDPTDCLTGTDVDLPVQLDSDTRARLLAYHGLDKPLWRQLVGYAGNLARLDLGYAIYYKCDVSRLIGQRLPWTLLLAGSAFVLSTVAGVLLGTWAAYRQGSALDKALVGTVMGLRAMPAYLVGMLAIVLLSVKLQLLPLGGAAKPFEAYATRAAAALDIMRHIALPVFVLTIEQVAGTVLIMRNSMVGIRGEPFMLLAEAKGLPASRRLFRYGMRNAVLPLYTRLGMHLGMLVTGTIFIESVFNYPGMGRLAYEAALVHDYPVLQGIFLVTTLSIVGANLLVDVTYPLVDPRLRRGHG